MGFLWPQQDERVPGKACASCAPASESSILRCSLHGTFRIVFVRRCNGSSYQGMRSVSSYGRLLRAAQLWSISVSMLSRRQGVVALAA